MKPDRLVAVLLLLVIFSGTPVHPQTVPNIVGKWRTTKIETGLNSDAAPKAWQIEFKADGTFRELMDEGFGIAEDYSGTWEIRNSLLMIKESWLQKPVRFKFSLKSDSLSLRCIDGPKWQAQLKQSDDIPPELARLPKTPRTVEEAVATLRQVLKPGDLDLVQGMKKDELIRLHFALGMYIRNGFGLWGKNEELRKACGGPTTHPDHASMVIIEALWRDLQNNP